MSNPNLSGKIQVQGEIVPDGASTVQPVTDVRYVTGASQPFESIAELVALHPKLMKRGVAYKVVTQDPNQALKIITYILMIDPVTMFDPQTLVSVLTEDNYLDFFTAQDETFSNFTRVNEYAPDDANGARPPYPYEDNLAFEANWTPVYDASKGHQWLRFRDDDIDANTDGVFDNWTLPIALGASIQGGDFIANRYARQEVTATVATNQGELVVTNLPGDDSGHYQILTGDIDVDDNGDITNLTVGKYFKYDAALTYTFNNGATCVQTLPPPNTSVSGNSNDDGVYTAASGLAAIIFEDDIPAGTDQLWEILGQKSVYGSLKSDWTIRKIIENPSLTRYSNGFTALPGTAAGTDDDAGAEPFNTDLINIGWEPTFQVDTTYLATRTLTGGSPIYTDWTVQKIAGESGEFKDRVFKLFPINTDFDQEAPPGGSDALAEGWSDTPLQETNTEINGVSESIKFFDGTLKIPWSVPVPYTGQNAFNDLIVSDFGATFKYEVNGPTPTVPVPALMTLEAQLFSGISALWPDETITYAWVRIYNNGAIDSTLADGDTGKTFYFLGEDGTPGDPAYKRFAQRLVVTAAGVDGKAVFECTQTLTLPDASTIVFIEEFVITDVTDGLDSKDLSISADAQLILYDVGGAEWAPDEVRLSAFQNNLPTGFTLFWYEETAPSTWTKLTSGVGGYTFGATPYGGQMQIDVTTVFTADGSLEQKRYAVSNIDGDPDTNDNLTTFTDYITIVKTDSSASSTPGADAVFAILDNESHVIIVDDITLAPVAGEIGSSGKAKTIITVYDGSTRIVTGSGAGKYLIVLSTDNGDITGGQQIVGSDVEVFIATWLAGERSANIKATISYETGDARGTIVIDKIFSVNSTLDAAGAILLVIDSDDGRFSFFPEDLTDIDLVANLYNDKFTPPLQDPAAFFFSWKVGSGAFETVKAGGGGTLGEKRTITRDEIRLSGIVEVRVFTVAVPTIPDDVIRTTSLLINDVQDGATFHLYQTDTTPFSKPSPPAETIDPAVGDGSWEPTLDPLPIVWAVDGTQKPFVDWGNPAVPEYTWSDVYQIGSEAGSQGNQGGGYFYMYSTHDNGLEKPTFEFGNTQSIDQALSGTGRDEWLSVIPAVDKIWQTQRLYKGFTATSDTVKLDGSGKLVGGDDSPAEAVAGSTWTTPQLLSGNDGIEGDDGWAPELATVSDGPDREVHQVVDWIGGTGSKPATGDYIGVGGFVTDIVDGKNIKGNAGIDGDDALAEGLQEVDFQTSLGPADDGIERQFSGVIEFTTLVGSKSLGFTGAIEIYGSNFSAYDIEFLSNNTIGGSYGFKQRIRIVHDAGAVTSAPQNIAFHMIYADSNKFHKISIKRISGSANTIAGCMVEGKIYN